MKAERGGGWSGYFYLKPQSKLNTEGEAGAGEGEGEGRWEWKFGQHLGM